MADIRKSIFDSMKDKSDEEVIYELFSKLVHNMPENDREKFVDLLKKGGVADVYIGDKS